MIHNQFEIIYNRNWGYNGVHTLARKRGKRCPHMFSRAIRWSKAYWWIYVILRRFSAFLFHSCCNLMHIDETNYGSSFIGVMGRKIHQFCSFFYKENTFNAETFRLFSSFFVHSFIKESLHEYEFSCGTGCLAIKQIWPTPKIWKFPTTQEYNRCLNYLFTFSFKIINSIIWMN